MVSAKSAFYYFCSSTHGQDYYSLCEISIPKTTARADAFVLRSWEAIQNGPSGNIITHMWKNTLPHVIANCSQHISFVRPEPKGAAVAEEVLAEPSNDDCLRFDAYVKEKVLR